MDEALERRIVTVLFADLVGFTTLSERLDAEDVAAIQDRYFASVRDTIGRYGGRLEKFIGDAAMAVFGVPRARDDDAERAVRAGLALTHAVQQLGVALGLEEDTLRLRVGVNSGEAVVATGGVDEGRVTGDTVNTAARLQTAAPPGGVLIGESTALAVADVADLDDPMRLELKGKAEPVTARLVGSMRSEPSREQAMGALRAPTIGRERELAELQRALDEAGAGNVGRWLIVAPPGVGKSRLMREAADRATGRRMAVVWRARARSGAVSPFDAIAGLAISALGAGTSDTDIGPRIERALREKGIAPSRAAVVSEALSSLVSPRDGDYGVRPPSEDRDALFTAWLEGLDALAGNATQVWLVEDVHWAGGDVLAFLDLAGSRPVAHGRLVIATARPSVLESRPDWAEANADAAQQVVRLGTLVRADAQTLVTALVGNALPGDLVERIAERSDGNCLFIEELLRTWVSVGTLVDNGAGEWQLTLPADEIPLPQSVQQIYAAQLDDLPPDARRLARRASVCGRRFPLRALEPLDASDDGLDPLRRRELVMGPISEPLFGDAFAYRHALLRDAGYASLARAERARLHARLARWLAAAAGAHSGEVAEQIAGHYAAAVESAPALAANIDGGLGRDEARVLAAEWFERAGHTALGLSAHEAARQLLRRSIDFTSSTAALDLARRWQRLAEATAFAADMNEGAADFEKSIELYRAALGQERSPTAIEGLATATASLADVWYQQLRFQDAHDLADATLSEMPDADPGSRARLLIARSRGTLGASGGSAGVEADLLSAVELAEQTDDEGLALLAREALTSMRAETWQSSADEWHDLAAEALRLGDARMAVGASINAAFTMVDDAPRGSFDALEQVRDLAVAHGLTEDTGWISFLQAEERFAAGKWDDAVRLGKAAMDLGEANAYLRLTVRTIHVMVPIAAARGDLVLLERCQRWYAGLEGKFEFPDSPYARIVRPAQDLELADAGLRPGYVPDVAGRIASFTDDAAGPSWSAALDRVLRCWVENGLLDAAEEALEAMRTTTASRPGVSHLGLGTFSLMRGRVAAARGKRDDAADLGRDALAHFRTSDAPWWMAKALRLLERLGAADEQLLAEVASIERRLGIAAPTR